MTTRNLILNLFLTLCVAGVLVSANVEKVLNWKQVTYTGIPDNELGAEAFIPINNVPMSAVHHKGRVFVTVPRRRLGIPSTLMVVDVSQAGYDKSPALRPYPDYETNRLGAIEPNPKRLVTVYRPRVDRCDRLWFVDTGMMEIPNNFTIVQRPSVWVFDLKTDKPIDRYEIPKEVVDSGYGLTSITLDIDPDNCEKVFVYISDLQTYRMLVYDYQNKRSWRFLHNYFFLNPLEGDFKIAGINFAWDDGIFSIALSNPNPQTKDRTAFFHALASNSEFAVSTKVLKSEENSKRHWHGDDFKLFGYRGNQSQSSIHAFDPETGVIIFALIQQNAISCWDSAKGFVPENFHILYRNDAEIVYPNDLSIDPEGNVWFMSNSIVKLLYAKLDPSEFNFHVWKANIKAVIKGTICDPKVKASSQTGNRLSDKDDRIHFVDHEDRPGPGGGPYGGWGWGDHHPPGRPHGPSPGQRRN
uniref:Putative yellow-related salivary protein n=1 Tax=Corethrella appendiculata TaxID=1370023 RepID=U5EUI9_9DIPT